MHVMFPHKIIKQVYYIKHQITTGKENASHFHHLTSVYIQLYI